MQTLRFGTLLVFFAIAPLLLHGQEGPPLTEEIADRYEEMLMRSPGSGIAFDRVIEWYSTEGGGLEALKSKWIETKAREDSDQVALLCLLGLLEERLRSPAAARERYTEALEISPDPLVPARLLATLETTEGNFEAAAAAFEKGLTSPSLAPPDRMDLMRSLALLHQRSFNEEAAAEVWKETIEVFPDDPYVLEEAGEAFLAIGDFAAAREAFTALGKLAQRDPFRRVAASLRLARVSEMEGNTEEATRLYSLLLSETSESGWIHREIRSRIEDLFRRRDDLPGLLEFYEIRLGAEPRDYQSLAAKATVLQDLGKEEEAIAALREAIAMAPNDPLPRMKLIRSLAGGGQRQEALQEAIVAARAENAPPEILILLGNLHWEEFDVTGSEQDRLQAMAAWKRLAPPALRDPGAVAQLAELLLERGEDEAAAEQWQRLIDMVPDAADARIRLAELRQKHGDAAGAREVLSGLIEGGRDTAEGNLILFRAQRRLGWEDEAAATLEKALHTYPENFELLSLAFQKAVEEGDPAGAAEFFPRLHKHSPNEFFADDAIKRYVLFLEGAELGEAMSESLAARLETEAVTPLDALLLLRLSAARRDEERAQKAVEFLRSGDAPLLALRAEVQFARAFGDSATQIAALQALAAADPRLSADSLREVAGIQVESGQTDAALETLSELIARSPADVSLHIYFADVATRAGKTDKAIRRLSEATRLVEDGTSIRMQLSNLLWSLGRTEEASRVLQEAFEQETRDARKFEIFRRQVEIARTTGRLDDLIADLREKQAKERGGARYGAYLAEIYLQQNDYLSAREELAKSLGHNPSDAMAVARLLDLADRGGDQEEGIRLAERLVELEPSPTHRVDLLVRLLEGGEEERALQEIRSARSEMVQAPEVWSKVLPALGRAGLERERDLLIEEIAASAGEDPLLLLEVAQLRIAQREFVPAEELLWQIVESGDLAESFSALLGSTSPTPVHHYSPYSPFGGGIRGRLQLFWQLQHEAQHFLHQAFQQMHGGRFGHRGMIPRSFIPGASTPEVGQARARVRALYLLSHLARARNQSDAFADRSNALLLGQNVSLEGRFAFFNSIGHTATVEDLLSEIAESTQPVPELDQFVVQLFPNPSPSVEEVVEIIRARAAENDPEFAFQVALTDLMRDFSTAVPGGYFTRVNEEVRQEFTQRIAGLISQPILKSNPSHSLQLAQLAAAVQDYTTAFALLENLDQQAHTSPNFQHQIFHVRNRLIGGAILDGVPEAEDWLVALLEGQGQVLLASTAMGMRGSHPLLQQRGELILGSPVFPFSYFQGLQQIAMGSNRSDVFNDWFEERGAMKEADPFSLGRIYVLWTSGERKEATEAARELFGNEPDPATAALLLEMLEVENRAEEALDLLEIAAFQQGESKELRTFRTIRLLRQANRLEEAREEARRLASTRGSMEVRQHLQQEIRQLGIPPNELAGGGMPGIPRTSRPTTDRNQQLHQQISKLIQEDKKDEAERIALEVLSRPLPGQNDHSAMNLRHSLVQSLRSMERLKPRIAHLQEQLKKNPENIDLALRLAEYEFAENSAEAVKRLADHIVKHPEGMQNLGFAMALIRRTSDQQEQMVRILGAILNENPEMLQLEGIGPQELMQFSQNPESGARLAEIFASLSPEVLEMVFFTSRLFQQTSEGQFLGQLAEFAVMAEEPEQAILLLERSLEGPESGHLHLHHSFPVLLRLADLQMEMGDEEAAAASMRKMIQQETLSPFLHPGHRTGRLSQVLINQLFQVHPGHGGEGQLEQLVKIAEATGTKQELIDRLMAEDEIALPFRSSLFLRTLFGQEEAIQEWRKILLEKTSLSRGMLQSHLVPNLLAQLLKEPDADKLVPALLLRFSQQGQSPGGDIGFAVLARSLPMLDAFRDEPATAAYINRLISLTSQNPSQTQYFVHSENYRNALAALIAHGFIERARKLFDATAPARAANQHTQNQFAAIEGNLMVAEGKIEGIQVNCAGFPATKGRLQVFYQVAPLLEDVGRDGQMTPPAWEHSQIPIPRDKLPVQLEFFAGANPALLESVAVIEKPKQEGAVEIDIDVPLGLLQAGWTMPDGSVNRGPLTAFLQGENLLVNGGFQQEKVPSFVKTGLPGPTGPESATRFDGPQPTSQLNLPLASIPWKKEWDALVFIGWLQAGASGNFPRLQMDFKTDAGATQSDGIHYSGTPAGWVQVVRIWAHNTTGGSVRRAPDDVSQFQLILRLNATRGFRNQFFFEGGWAGLQFVNLLLKDYAAEAGKLITEAKAAADKKENEKAVRLYTKAFHTDPGEVLRREGTTMWQTFLAASQGEAFLELLASPALYQPDPLRQNQPTMQNLDLLQEMAVTQDNEQLTANIREWTANLLRNPLPETTRFPLEVADFSAKQNSYSREEQLDKLLALAGFSQVELQTGRLHRLWDFRTPAQPFAQIIDMLKAFPDRQVLLERVTQLEVPVEQLAARMFLEAYMKVDSDPEAALEIWKKVRSLQAGGQSRVNIPDHANQRFLARVSQTHPDPEHVITSVQEWIFSNQREQDRRSQRLAEVLFMLADQKSDKERKAYFQNKWAEVEMSAMTSIGYRLDTNRVKALLTMLQEQQNWSAVLELSQKLAQRKGSLSSHLRTLLQQQSDLAALAEGDVSLAWPVAWMGNQKIEDGKKFYWKWSTKDTGPALSRNHFKISLGDDLPIEAISGKSRLDIFFGEMPGNLQLLTSLKTDAFHGTTTLSLPSPNGFLRAVAIVHDEKTPGPLVPVVSGKPVFPAGDGGLPELFSDGEIPLPASVFKESEPAPDGSSAFLLEEVDEKSVRFLGPSFPLESGKTYLHQAWLKRATPGRGRVGLTHREELESGERSSSIYLSNSSGPSGSWVYLTRLIPVLPSYFRGSATAKSTSVAPNLLELTSGTAVAGWQFLEVDDWEYLDWVRDLSRLREEFSEEAPNVILSRMLDLSAADPLTTLRFHGTWMISKIATPEVAEQLIDLFRQGFVAEPNPLFEAPSLDAIFQGLLSIAEMEALPLTVRWKAVRTGVEKIDQAEVRRQLAILHRYLLLAGESGRTSEAESAIVQFFEKLTTDQDTGSRRVSQLLDSFEIREHRPHNDFLSLILALDQESAAQVLALAAQSSMAKEARNVLTMTTAAIDPEFVEDFDWQTAGDEVLDFRSTSPSQILFRRSNLADILEARNVQPDVVLRLRQETFDRLTALPADRHSGGIETLRAGWMLLESVLQTGDETRIHATRASIAEQFKRERKQYRPEELRFYLFCLQALEKAGRQEDLQLLVEAWDPDISIPPDLQKPLGAFLSPPAE